jgi:hypothetical protein
MDVDLLRHAPLGSSSSSGVAPAAAAAPSTSTSQGRAAAAGRGRGRGASGIASGFLLPTPPGAAHPGARTPDDPGGGAQ